MAKSLGLWGKGAAERERAMRRAMVMTMMMGVRSAADTAGWRGAFCRCGVAAKQGAMQECEHNSWQLVTHKKTERHRYYLYPRQRHTHIGIHEDLAVGLIGSLNWLPQRIAG
jgi:hypothetical protein